MTVMPTTSLFSTIPIVLLLASYYSTWNGRERKYEYDGVPVELNQEFVKISDLVDAIQIRDTTLQTTHAIGFGDFTADQLGMSNVVKLHPGFIKSISCSLSDTAYWAANSYSCKAIVSGQSGSPGLPNSEINADMIAERKSCFDSSKPVKRAGDLDMHSSEEEQFSLTVSPNPTMGDFSVSLRVGQSQNVFLRLTDIYGREIVSQEVAVAPPVITLNMSIPISYPAGTYIVECSSSTPKEINRQFIIKVK